jgi:hypothetical protein
MGSSAKYGEAELVAALPSLFIGRVAVTAAHARHP